MYKCRSRPSRVLFDTTTGKAWQKKYMLFIFSVLYSLQLLLLFRGFLRIPALYLLRPPSIPCPPPLPQPCRRFTTRALVFCACNHVFALINFQKIFFRFCNAYASILMPFLTSALVYTFSQCLGMFVLPR